MHFNQHTEKQTVFPDFNKPDFSRFRTRQAVWFTKTGFVITNTAILLSILHLLPPGDCIQTVQSQKFLMRSALYNFPVTHYVNLIRLHCCCEPMTDHQRRFALRQPAEALQPIRLRPESIMAVGSSKRIKPASRKKARDSARRCH